MGLETPDGCYFEHLTKEGNRKLTHHILLKYHISWNWLMPVIEEIDTHGCEVVISSNGVTTIYSDKGKVLVEEDSEADDHMHDATYKAVVTYIKEHWAILGGTAQ